MNLVLSTPTSRGGGMMLRPVNGTAHIAFPDGAVLDVPLTAVTGATLVGLTVNFDDDPSVALGEPEVWFEDVREVSH